MILFIDTETTGKANMRSGRDHPQQPHIAQLAAMVTDRHGHPLATFSTLIKPSGWRMPDEAARINGLSTKLCDDAGMPMSLAMSSLSWMAHRCEVAVAHNLDFDSLMIDVECYRLGMANPIDPLELQCTMRMATPLLKLPGRFGEYKWPSLKETHLHFFNTEVAGAHDAMADVLACAKCYFEIKKALAPDVCEDEDGKA